MRRSVASLPEYAQERQVTVQVGRLGGFDLRPSRLFFWLGRDRDRRQRIVSYGRPPKVLRTPRRRAYVHLGGLEIAAAAAGHASLAAAYSHSMVLGGLLEMSYTTRLTSGTSLMMREASVSSTS
jgi:hypothetical protein